EDYLAMIVKSFDEQNEIPNHNCIILKENLLISIIENENNLLPAKVERIKNVKARKKKKKADYLFFTLLDTFIDSYYRYFESIREELFDLENTILYQRSENHIDLIYKLNHKLTAIRKNLFPLKTAIAELIKSDTKLIDKKNYSFFNDCKDHVNELIEYYNSFTDMLQSLVNLNENNIVNNTNKVMKILTIIATIFIPLTFVAGIYGMNFKNMPELEWEYGYQFAIGLMIFIGMVILGFMKKKNWF
ncbi:MAG: magnesium/cobalt transporter CorA, partial [Ignavibacteriae bacterium]|nr:magnesium/cobalt transporter CorA [Ignavibacteriota bacterium]